MEPVRAIRKNMNSKLQRIMDACRVRMPDGPYNHVSLFGPSCRLFIDGDYDEFIRLYSSLYNEYKYGIAEIQGAYAQIVVDIDIKVPHNAAAAAKSSPFNHEVAFIDNKLYTKEQVREVVRIYQEKLREVLYNPNDETCVKDTQTYLEQSASGIDGTYLESAPVPDLTAFVLEKPRDYTYKGYRKSGFHIHFPYVVMCVQHITAFVYSQVATRVEAVIPGSVDDNMCTKPILMYGSRKSENMDYYRLTTIYGGDGAEIPIDDYFMDVACRPEYNGCESIPEMLPRFLSMSVAGKQTCVVRPYLTAKPIYTKDDYKITDDYSYDYNFDDNLDEVSALLNMLSDERATNHDKWIEVGWVLYNISGASKAGYELWVEFSKRTRDPSKFDIAVCAFEWMRMKRGKYTIRTLKYFASIDSPEEYTRYKRQAIKENYIANLRDTDTDFADMLQLMLGDVYKCANIEKDMWYFFHNHRWHRMDGAHDLRKRIDKDLKQLYFNFMQDCKVKRDAINQYMSSRNMLGGGEANEPPQDDDDDDDDIMADIRGKDADDLVSELEHIDEQVKKACEIIKALGSCGKKNLIIKECRFKFYDQYFCDMLDENPYLMGFNNGVYDFQLMTFRDGRPIDYVSKCVGYDYKELGTPDDFDVAEVDKFMLKLYPDPHLREYVWQNDASNLVGGNLEKLFVVGSGPKGNNGKSQKQHLIEAAFGDYCIHLPTSLVVGKRTASSACTPELSRAPGARIAFVQEPDNSDTFQCGIIKELTGNDRIYVRALFMEGREVCLMFKLHMICNYLPRVNTTDPAFWNRLIIIPYESVFVPQEMCPASFEEQVATKVFPDDKNISIRLKQLRHVYMWMLIQKYKALLSGACKKLQPMDVPKIYESTKAYRENTDVVGKFLSAQYITDKHDHTVSMPLDDMFRSFKVYLTDMGYSTKADICEFTFYINSKLKVIGDRVMGVRAKDTGAAAPQPAQGAPASANAAPTATQLSAPSTTDAPDDAKAEVYNDDDYSEVADNHDEDDEQELVDVDALNGE